MADLTTDQVWAEIEKNLFAVLGMVTAKNEARTVGIVYIVHERKLYIATLKNAWKTRHVAQNGHVSLTVTIPKRIPLMPWIKIPAATITFAGEATVRSPDELDKQVLAPLYRGLEGDSAYHGEFSHHRGGTGGRFRHIRRRRLIDANARHRIGSGTCEYTMRCMSTRQ